MTIDLTDTSTGAIHEALTQARRRMGGPASGTVLTLIIVTDESEQYDAVRAASQAGREHPSRILAVITRRPKGESRLDAEIRVGETGPGETILLRMYGPWSPGGRTWHRPRRAGTRSARWPSGG
jgi:glucose-6-phosphate dehydrogenase assembly protein OpcA